MGTRSAHGWGDAEPFAEGLRSGYGTPLPAAAEAIDLAPCEGIVLIGASAR